MATIKLGTLKKGSTTLALRLRAARIMQGLSQLEVGKKAGLQPSAISHFETGARKPSFDNFCRLADALGVSADYLIGRSTKEITP